MFLPTLAPLVLALAPPQEPSPDPAATTLWYDEPAGRWEAALPVGNGRLGAMVHGGVGREVLQLNEDTIWAGAPLERERSGAREHLAQARRLFFEGEVARGQELMQREFMSERLVRSYQPLGELVLAFPELEEPAEYRRSLDLDTGLAVTTFEAGGARHARTVFSTAADGVLVVRLEREGPDGGLDFDLALTRARGARTTYDESGVARIEGRASHLDGDGNEVHAGVRFAAFVAVVHEGGTVTASDGGLEVRGAEAATLLLSAGTDYRGGSPDAEARRDLAAAAGRSYEELLARHLGAHRRLFRRVALDLGGHAARARPTDERLAAVRAGTDDPDLAALYFQYGRYLLLSCSRPGSMPANLQGLWNPHLEAPWNSDYHVNINCQMNYWPAEVTNLAECHEPFFELVDGLRARGRKTARELYGAPGWVAHHTTDAWWFTVPIGRTVWGLWPTGGAWCTRHLYEHYLFGRDERFLRERAWPVMLESAEFFLGYLAEDPETGRLVSGPSSSPENRFRTTDGQVADTCMGASMDQQIVWDLFTNVLEAAAVLRLEDDPKVAAVRAARERLAGPRLGTDGRLLEWSREYEEVEPGHRHMSHLFGLHPGRQFTFERSPELVAACGKVLEHRLANGGGHTGWSRAWIVNFQARLRDGGRAHEHLTALLAKSTLENLFDDHPPFQIDGNFGGCAGIAEMLLQSHDGTLRLLPALPPAWKAGSVRGLRARGGLTVDIEWEDGALVRARLRADRSLSAMVRLGERSASLAFAAGAQAVLGPEDFR